MSNPSVVPAILEPVSFATAISGTLPTAGIFASLVILVTHKGTQSSQCLKHLMMALIATGPEGGMDGIYRSGMGNSSWVTVSLNRRILRAVTAPSCCLITDVAAAFGRID